MRCLVLLCTVFLTLLAVRPSPAQSVPPPPVTLPLWPGDLPAPSDDPDAPRPTLHVYRPAPNRATGTAIVVCPGGGYWSLAATHEGRDVAQFLNGLGITAFVLHYRRAPHYRHPAPLHDALRALRYVRHHATDYGLDPQRIGILGFSAGGHLAATASTLYDTLPPPDPADPVDRTPARPDFAVLAYPVITFTEPYMHAGSRRNLLGEDPDPALVRLLSPEHQVTPQTPPTFLFHTSEDTGVPPQNSIAYYLALRDAGVPAELHIYERGPHGVGLAPFDPVVSTWADRLADWLHLHGLLD